MSGAPPTQPPARRAGWRSVLSDPAIASIALYTLLAMAATVTAFFSSFTIWASYDDEGTLLVTLQAFVEGDTLYRDVYSPYGPFYHELFGGFFALTGIDVSTDASRSIVTVLWVATSFLFGIAAQRLTRSLLLGGVAMLAAFATLYVLANEPMHPQVLCVLLLGGFLALAAFGPGRRPLWSGAAAGALVAALAMTKLNLGVYAGAAILLAAAIAWEPLRSRRWLSWPAVAAVIALPLIVAWRDFGLEWVRDFVAAQTLAIAAVAVAAWPLGAGREAERDGTGRWLLGAVAGAAVAAVAIAIVIVANGTTPSELYDGMVTEALRVRDVNMSQFPMAPAVVDWAVLAVAAAALSLRLRPPAGRPSIWLGVLKALAGLAILSSATRIAPFSLGPSAANQDSLAAVLCWVAVIPPPGLVEGPFKRFLRVMVPALGAIEVLQVYPVAGSQMGIAALTLVPAGTLCLGDALVSLRDWSATRGADGPGRFAAASTAALVALAGILAINAVVRPGGHYGQIYYRDNVEVPFPGASQLRLPATDAENYVRLVELLREHRCTDFIGYPNFNSLYLWSEIKPPAPTAPGAWIEALDSERQARVVRQLRRSPRPCAIRNEGQAEAWLGGAEPPDRPLVRYVNEEFRPVEQVGETFEFMLPIRRGS